MPQNAAATMATKGRAEPATADGQGCDGPVHDHDGSSWRVVCCCPAYPASASTVPGPELAGDFRASVPGLCITTPACDEPESVRIRHDGSMTVSESALTIAVGDVGVSASYARPGHPSHPGPRPRGGRGHGASLHARVY